MLIFCSGGAYGSKLYLKIMTRPSIDLKLHLVCIKNRSFLYNLKSFPNLEKPPTNLIKCPITKIFI